jgi:hypothetical protein
MSGLVFGDLSETAASGGRILAAPFLSSPRSTTEGLAQQSDSRPAVAYVWCDCNETEEQALERLYADRPGDRAAKSTYVFSWLGDRRRDREDAEAADEDAARTGAPFRST